MALFFTLLYDFFSKHRSLIILFLLITALAFVYSWKKINIEEDISKVAPGADSKTAQVLKQLKMADNIMIHICLSDTNAAPVPEKLISFAEVLTDSLKSASFKPYIKTISGTINDSLILNVMDVFCNNLPVFLAGSDYAKIDSLISSQSVLASLEKDYKTLLSPGSFVFKKFIKRDPIGISSLAFDKLKQLQFDDNYEILDGYIFTRDKKHLLLSVYPENPSNKTSENSLFVEKLDELFQSLISRNNYAVHAEYFGAATVAAGNATQVKKDIVLSVFISLLIIIIFVTWYFRKISTPFMSLLPAVFGGAIAIIIIYFSRSNISVIALTIGSVLLGIIVDYALYIFSVYKTKDTFEELLKDMSQTITLCAITSATAFLSLMFVKSEVLQDLGLFAGISVLGAAFFSLAFLPHFIKWKRSLPEMKKRKTFVDRISEYPFEANRVLVLVIIFISVGFYFFSGKVLFEKDISKMNFLSEKYAVAEHNLNRINDNSLHSVYIIATGKTLDEALSVNAGVAETLNVLHKQNTVKKYSTVSSVLIADSIQHERINRWNTYWTAGKKAGLKKSIAENSKKLGFTKDAFKEFYDILDKQFEPVSPKIFDNTIKALLNEMITESPDLAMIVSLVKVHPEGYCNNKSNCGICKTSAGVNYDRDKVLAAFSGNPNVVVLDRQKMVMDFANDIEADFNLIVNICLIFVSLILIITFGRIEIGIIAAVPMFISWLWTLGIMGIFGLKFNVFNILISTFIFGLGVDYSILMVRGLMLDYKYGRRDLPSYKTPVFLSAFTTIAGVGVLILAKHPAVNSIGLISIIGLFSVVLITYTVAPILFRLLVYTKSGKRRVPMSLSDIIYTCVAFGVFISGCLSMNLLLPVLYIMPVRKKMKKIIMHSMMKGFCRFEVYLMFNVKKRIINEGNENFKKPALIIANHQSHIDLLLLLMLNTKTIVITNNWVWNNPVYSLVIRYLDFYNVSEGYEKLVEKLKLKVQDGYSILIFPEGRRSENSKIMRFHKGAFVIAEQLNLEIVPVIIHGAGDCMNKGENFLKSGTVTMKISGRIKPEDSSFGIGYSERGKSVLRFFRNEYSRVSEECGTAKYYRRKLLKNYIYKGPVLEWYSRVKIKNENNYELFNRLIPRNASVVDMGCGYGFLSYMLNFLSDKRKITGVDYDADKIVVANNCISKNDNVNFVHSDVLNYPVTPTDAFVLLDVLHYFDEGKQENLIVNLIKNLNENGIIIIRDAEKKLGKRHWGTIYTEVFSTIAGFNKRNEKKLFFTSTEKIKEIASKHDMLLEIVDQSWFTSNLIYIMRKK